MPSLLAVIAGLFIKEESWSPRVKTCMTAAVLGWFGQKKNWTLK